MYFKSNYKMESENAMALKIKVLNYFKIKKSLSLLNCVSWKNLVVKSESLWLK